MCFCTVSWSVCNGSTWTSFYYDSWNLSEPWYSKKSLINIGVIRSCSGKEKGTVGLIIAGVVGLIIFLASAATSALALAKKVQTSSFVHHLAENVTNALHIQEDLDR